MILKKNTTNKRKRILFNSKILILKPKEQLLTNGKIENIPIEKPKIEIIEKPKIEIIKKPHKKNKEKINKEKASEH